MKRHLLIGLMTATTLFLAAVRPAAAIGAKANVVATLPALAAIVKEVGGDSVSVTALAFPSQDPHFVDARPNLVLPLNRADLLVVNGLDLEIGWLPVLQTGARNAAIQKGAAGYLDCSTLVPLKQVPHTKIDRSMGDVHAGGNPHYLTDPRNGARVALGIAHRLGQLMPRHAAEFNSRANAFSQNANALAAKESAQFAKLPDLLRHVVAYHDSWVYLLDWLSLQQFGTIEPKPGIAPTPQHVAQLLGQMKEHHVDGILQETYYPSRFAQLLSEKSGATFISLPGGPNFDQGETYLHYVSATADKIYAALLHYRR